ncbi:MAG: hypothetical protein QGF72_00155 [Candidatus Poseidoniaceae archaeon]|jgi:hypothetical protein|nr:hypothetical protein [Candidatus Poseidoniaceae archaeon]
MQAWNWMKGKYNDIIWPTFVIGAGVGTLLYGVKKFTNVLDRIYEIDVHDDGEINIEGGE